MTLSAHDVTRELRARLPRAGGTKVQKLLYYSQGWHVTLTGARLFDEPIEAWENFADGGPTALWNLAWLCSIHHRRETRGWHLGPPDPATRKRPLDPPGASLAA